MSSEKYRFKMAMFRGTRQFAAILCFGLLSGCTYDRGVGWRWDADGIRDGVVNSVASMVSGSQTTAESMEDDSDEFFNR